MSLSIARRYIERSYPAVFAVGCLLFCVLRHHQVMAILKDHSISLPQLYTAIFGRAAVQASGLLGIYGMIFSKSDGFIGRIRGTDALGDFYAFTRLSIYASIVLTLFSLPILAKNIDAKDLNILWYLITSVWFALFIYAIASFVRSLGFST